MTLFSLGARASSFITALATPLPQISAIKSGQYCTSLLLADTKRGQLSEFVIGAPVTSKGSSFMFTAFLPGVFHPWLVDKKLQRDRVTILTTGKQTTTWFSTENQCFLWEQLLEKLFFKHKAAVDMIGQIPLFPSFLKKNKATMNLLHTLLCPSNRNAVAHLHIWQAVVHYWK